MLTDIIDEMFCTSARERSHKRVSLHANERVLCDYDERHPFGQRDGQIIARIEFVISLKLQFQYFPP